VRLLAAEIMLSRGFGKPVVTVDANTTHAFIVAPAALSEADWVNAYASGVAKRPEPSTRLMDVTAEEPPDKHRIADLMISRA
jgi:hypothetical protein